jgi:hypothetical protein
MHPDDPDRIIKITREKNRSGNRDANWKEWNYYHYLKKKCTRLDFISNYHGFVETNLGRGLLIDCIRDYDGRVSRRLEDVLNNQVEYDMTAVVKAVESLCREIIDYKIHLFDLNLFNILIQVLSEGKYKAVCVDLKGRYNNYELIPVSSYIPFFTTMKLKRRCKRLLENVQQAITKNTIHNSSNMPHKV